MFTWGLSPPSVLAAYRGRGGNALQSPRNHILCIHIATIGWESVNQIYLPGREILPRTAVPKAILHCVLPLLNMVPMTVYITGKHCWNGLVSVETDGCYTDRTGRTRARPRLIKFIVLHLGSV